MSARPAPTPCAKHDRAYARTKREVVWAVRTAPKRDAGGAEYPAFIDRKTTGWICRKCGTRGRATGKHRGSTDYAKTVVQFHWRR